MGKYKPNDPCPCKSGNKFKKCCKGKETTIDTDGNTINLCGYSYEDACIQETNTCPEIKAIIDDLQMRYPAAKVVDVSNLISTEKQYRALQLRRISSNWIMVAERQPMNEAVFKPRIASTDSEDTNVMVLYHGHFRTFAEEDYQQIVDSLSSMDNITILRGPKIAQAEAEAEDDIVPTLV